jgi:hypothetical protein
MISKLYPIIVIQHKLGRYRFRRAKTATGKEFFVRILLTLVIQTKNR